MSFSTLLLLLCSAIAMNANGSFSVLPKGFTVLCITVLYVWWLRGGVRVRKFSTLSHFSFLPLGLFPTSAAESIVYLQVTVEFKTNAHPFFGLGNTLGYSISVNNDYTVYNATGFYADTLVQGASIKVQPGVTYIFNLPQGAIANHPLYISTTAHGASISTDQYNSTQILTMFDSCINLLRDIAAPTVLCAATLLFLHE